ncbi:GAF domain-containing protein, partial [bacterium]
MRAAPHRDEAARLSALKAYGILDTPQETDFDDIVALAAQICDMPVALVTLLDEDRQWFKAKVGTDLPGTSRDVSFCAHGILQPEEVVQVPDATLDERFRDNPLVTGELGVRFYAGVAFKTPEGLPLGTLCVLDTKPRELTDLQKNTLRTLARQVMAQLELRRQARQIEEERVRFRNLLDDMPAHVVVLEGPEFRYEFGNRAFREFVGGDEIAGKMVGEAWDVPDELPK